MFEPFTGNYVANLAVNIALCSGAAIGDVDDVRRALNVDQPDERAHTEAFFRAWCDVANRLVEQATADEEARHPLSAGEKYLRASIYFHTAERMSAFDFEPRKEAYRRSLDCFERYTHLTGQPIEAVEIPYGDSSFPAWFVPSDRDGPSPCMIFVNGFDSTKEQVFTCGFAAQLRRRGVATLMIDQPGSGRALRHRGLPATSESERWASPCVDVLQARSDVDAARIGIAGWSLGGYFAPRAAAFEPRLAACVAWGGNYDWGAVQQRRRQNQGDLPVPHYWEHARWVWGVADMDEFWRLAPQITLRGVLDRIRVPLLVVHGSGDRQIPLEYAQRTYDEAINSPARELRVIDKEHGGIEHCSVDNIANTVNLIADWVTDTLGDERTVGPTAVVDAGTR